MLGVRVMTSLFYRHAKGQFFNFNNSPLTLLDVTLEIILWDYCIAGLLYFSFLASFYVYLHYWEYKSKPSETCTRLIARGKTFVWVSNISPKLWIL